MKSLLALPLLALLLAYPVAHRTASAPGTSGVVHAAVPHGHVGGILSRATASRITLRTSSGAFTQVKVGRGARVATSDGTTVVVSAMRTGDNVTVDGAGTLHDSSLRKVTISNGIVVGPAEPGDVLVLSVPGSGQVVADTSSRTSYRDLLRQTPSISQLTDGDTLRVSGILDSNLGEMTQVTSILRTGPTRYLSHST